MLFVVVKPVNIYDHLDAQMGATNTRSAVGRVGPRSVGCSKQDIMGMSFRHREI